MICYKTKLGYVVSFCICGVKVNVLDNVRKNAIEMAINYYNANSK